MEAGEKTSNISATGVVCKDKREIVPAGLIFYPTARSRQRRPLLTPAIVPL
jgi:hypothetical protein